MENIHEYKLYENKLLKYELAIDNEDYNILVTNHREAADFIIDNIEEDSAKVRVKKFYAVSVEEAMADKDFNHNYVMEIICDAYFPGLSFDRVEDLEIFLKTVDLISQ